MDANGVLGAAFDPVTGALRVNSNVAAYSTFSNEDYVAGTEDKYIAQVGTLSAIRTITLPAADSVPAGTEVTVADESGTTTASFYLVVEMAGSDTLLNPANLADTAQDFIKGPDVRIYVSNGVDQWICSHQGMRRPYIWWMHPRSIATPQDLWVPVPWNAPFAGAAGGDATGADEFGVSPNVGGRNTTIAAASNGNVLPQATINVADTSAFDDDGYLVITAPPGATIDTVVTYTGKTATTFTGCNSAYRGTGVGISTGTLATGQVVRQANMEYDWPTGYLWMTIIDLAMDNIPLDSGFAIRLRSIDNLFNFPIATQHHRGMNIVNQHGQVTIQPGTIPTEPSRIEVWHNSGGVRNVKKDNIQSPSNMQAFMSTR